MNSFPLAYRAGHARAQQLDQALADRFVEHTLVGDPAADAVFAAFEGVPAAQQSAWLREGVAVTFGAIGRMGCG